jgi:hypothetical protein
MLSSKYSLGGVLLTLLTGCGPSDSDSGEGHTATGGAATGGSASGGSATGEATTGGSTTGGAATGGAGTGGSGGTEAAEKTGFVALVDFPTGLQFQVNFRDGVGDASTQTCTTVKTDFCSASTCDEGAAPDPAEPVEPNAGTVTFTSTDVEGAATAVPASSGYYMTTITFDTGLGGGEKGLFKASGGDVPAFEQALDMPLALLLTQPAYVKDGLQSIPRGSDLSLSWLRGTEGVSLFVQGTSDRPDGLPGSAHVGCSFPSEQASGVIPSNLLQVLAPGTELLVLTTSTGEVTAGDYKVTLLTAYGVYNEAKDQRVLPTVN